MEATMNRNEERYRAVVESLMEGIVLADFTGVLVACNESAARILGLSRHALLAPQVEERRRGRCSTRTGGRSHLRSRRGGVPAHGAARGQQDGGGALRGLALRVAFAERKAVPACGTSAGR